MPPPLHGKVVVNWRTEEASSTTFEQVHAVFPQDMWLVVKYWPKDAKKGSKTMTVELFPADYVESVQYEVASTHGLWDGRDTP